MFPALQQQQGLTWVALGSNPWSTGPVAAQHPSALLNDQLSALHQLRRREEAILAITAAAAPAAGVTIKRAASSVAGGKAASLAGTGSANGNGNGIAKQPPVRLSRWRRDKCRMGSLEQQLQEKKAEAQQAAQDNFQLRMRAEALEHAVVAHELQMSMLGRSLLYPSAEARSKLAATYREFVSEASLLMLSLSEEANRPTDQPVLARLADMVVELRKVISQTYIQNPGIQFAMISMHLDAADDTKPARPDEAHWEAVALKVGVTPQQLDEIAAIWDLTEEAMAKMQSEALAVSLQLEQGMQKVAESTVLMELGRRLSAITFKQAMIYFSFCWTINARILTPLQLARALVHSFPYFVDTRALVATLLRVRRTSSGVSEFDA